VHHPSTALSHAQQVYAGDNITILCQAGYQPARIDVVSELIIPETVGEGSFVVTCRVRVLRGWGGESKLEGRNGGTRVCVCLCVCVCVCCVRASHRQECC